MKNILLAVLALCALPALSQQKLSKVYDTSWAIVDHDYSGGSRITPTPDGGYFIGTSFMRPIVDSWEEANCIIKADSQLKPQWGLNPWWSSLAHDRYLGNGLTVITSYNYGSGIACSKYDVAGVDMAGNTSWVSGMCIDDGWAYLNNVSSSRNRAHLFGTLEKSTGGAVGLLCDVDSLGNLLSSDTIKIPGLGFYSYGSQIYKDDSGNHYLQFLGWAGIEYPTIVKMRPDRTIAWSYEFRIADVFRISSMVSMLNGDVIFGGDIWSSTEPVRSFAIKLNAAGVCKWQKTGNGPGLISTMTVVGGTDLLLTASGQAIYPTNRIGGNTGQNVLIRTDSAMHIKWARNMSSGGSVAGVYTGMSAPYIKGPNEWVFAATIKHPWATTSFTTDSLGNGLCPTAPYTLPLSFRDTTFTLVPVTALVGHFPLLWLHGVPDTPLVKPLGYTDRCQPALQPTVTTQSKEISIFPNPAGATLHITSTSASTRVDVLDMTGRMLVGLHPDMRGDIDVMQLNNGNYLLRIYTDATTPTYKRLTILH